MKRKVGTIILAVLYERWERLRCRQCHRLSYASCNYSPPFRLLLKRDKICDKLGHGGRAEDILEKPKGMHSKTFLRLRLRAQEAESESMLAMGKQLGIG